MFVRNVLVPFGYNFNINGRLHHIPKKGPADAVSVKK